ncbi:MAG TPA: hypothetical protein PJ991_09110 [Kiritimatiellia bacterium]|nr:hypothetical protein [Kiritimatiellia bacterium]
MNNEELKQYCLERAGEQLPLEAQTFLNKNPEVKTQVDRLIVIQKLIALKQYELPHPSSSIRCMEAVSARIEQSRNASIWAKLTEWVSDDNTGRQLAYGAAALVICVAGASVLLRGGSADQALVQNTEIATPAVIELATEQPLVMAVTLKDDFQDAAIPDKEMLVSVNPEPMATADKPLIILRVDSTHQPERGRLSFGGDASVPVRFDY